MTGNDFVKLLLRSPLHGMISSSVLLVTVTGRKSGRPISIPVEYYEIGHELWVTSRRERRWWRNLAGGARVLARLRGHEATAHAESILDEGAVAAKLKYLFLRYPARARALGIRAEQGRPDPGDLRLLAQDRVAVIIKVQPG
jgi:hypothetical protein